MRRRCVAALLISVALVVAVAGSASADPPSQIRITGSDSLEVPAGAACAFPVLVEVEQNFKVISFAEPIGQGIATLTVGNIKAVVTNLETGGSGSFDISGPAFLDPSGTPLFGTGQTLLFTEEGLLHSAGRVTVDAAGEYHISGRTRDVCAMVSGTAGVDVPDEGATSTEDADQPAITVDGGGVAAAPEQLARLRF